mgnify:CR=1 FL=1
MIYWHELQPQQTSHASIALQRHLDAHIDRHRGVLLGGAKDPGTLFVKTVILAMRRDRGAIEAAGVSYCRNQSRGIQHSNTRNGC